MRCERCGRFGASPTKVVGDRKPRTPAENWRYRQAVIEAYTYGFYGEEVYVPEEGEDLPEGHFIFEVPLCPAHRGQKIIVGGRVARCDSCGRPRYGAGSYWNHLCEDCAFEDP